MQFVELKVKEADVLKLLSRIRVIFVFIMQILTQVIPG
jgi:hypothetical protein